MQKKNKEMGIEEPSNSNEEAKILKGKNFSITSDRDLVTIREFGRKLAAEIGFGSKDQTLIATALSEICRNVIEYAGNGEVWIEPETQKNPRGLVMIVSDTGPGIADIEQALQEGFTTGRGMGVGLSGANRIMDEFDIQSEMGKGTTVKMVKYFDQYGY